MDFLLTPRRLQPLLSFLNHLIWSLSDRFWAWYLTTAGLTPVFPKLPVHCTCWLRRMLHFIGAQHASLLFVSWGNECPTSALVLAYPQFDDEFLLETDASGLGLGAVLAQRQEDSLVRPIAFACHTLHPHESNYGTTEMEILTVVWAVKHFSTTYTAIGVRSIPTTKRWSHCWTHHILLASSLDGDSLFKKSIWLSIVNLVGWTTTQMPCHDNPLLQTHFWYHCYFFLLSML